MEKFVLLDKPWINYLEAASQHHDDTWILFYPENVIFTAQYLIHHLDFVQKYVYNRYPDAEKFNLDVLNGIEWKKAVFVIDASSYTLISAPDPIQNLINLDRRLRYQDARDHIFGGFRWIPYLEFFKLRWFLLLYAFSWIFLYRDYIRRLIHQILRYRPRSKTSR